MHPLSSQVDGGPRPGLGGAAPSPGDSNRAGPPSQATAGFEKSHRELLLFWLVVVPLTLVVLLPSPLFGVSLERAEQDRSQSSDSCSAATDDQDIQDRRGAVAAAGAGIG